MKVRITTTTGEPQLAPVRMEIVDDRAAQQAARISFEQFARNIAWYQAHSAEVFQRGRGRHICVAGEEMFVAETVHEALALAQAAHPRDTGVFSKFVPQEKHHRVYAYRRSMASV